MTTAGTARCWGDNSAGQASPPGDLGTITALSAGGDHTCAVTTIGTARCWGDNSAGQASPPGDLGTITAITAGDFHTCAVTTAGTARCWGSNDSGQASPPGDLGTITAITAGDFHTCAVTTTGTARCWGRNAEGQLGAAPAFTSVPPAPGQVGAAYTFTATADPSVTGYTLTAGTLPPGLTLNPDTGVLTGTPTAGGTFSFDVTATNQVHADTSLTWQLQINAATTSTKLDVTPSSPAVAGTVETLTATVIPAAAGSVQFKDGTTALGAPVPVSAGSALLTTTLASGTHSLSAVFIPADPVAFAGSTSNTVPYTVNAAPTITTLAVTPTSPAAAGTQEMLTATISPAAAGTVQFKDGTTAVGNPVIVHSGTAATTVILALGTHSLSAVFTPADPVAFSASASGPLSYTVNQDPTSTTLSAIPANPLFGHPVTLTAAVAPGRPSSLAPTGTVTFTDGSTPLATVALSSGQASFTTSQLQPGPHALTAHYNGDPNFLASTSPATTLSVGFSQPCLTGTQLLGLTVIAGQSLCLAPGSTILGGVTVAPGGALSASGAHLIGTLSSMGALGVSICSSSLAAPVTIGHSTGYVLLGADPDDPTSCGGNTFTGTLTLDSNTGGLEASANTITGPVTISGNSGSGLAPEDSTPEFENNHITAGSLTCTANTPTLTQTGNTVIGPRTGQCQ